MPIKNYTTTVPAPQSVAEIVGALAAHGATRIQQDYDAGRPVSIAFVIDTPAGLRAFRLPSSADRVKAVMLRQKVKTDDAQAERVAWRILRDWVLSQMAILETEMVAMDQIMLPYMVDVQGRTVYELYQSRQLLKRDDQQQREKGAVKRPVPCEQAEHLLFPIRRQNDAVCIFHCEPPCSKSCEIIPQCAAQILQYSARI